MNASDEPMCEEYVDCYITNECAPDSCSVGPDDVCGVNMIGGGYGPLNAVIDVYNCACGG